MKYKFRKKLKDPDIEQLVREIEDNLATQGDVDDKYKKVKDIDTALPTLTNMEDGETKVYYDGSNYNRYYRVGAKLFKTGNLTEV